MNIDTLKAILKKPTRILMKYCLSSQSLKRTLSKRELFRLKIEIDLYSPHRFGRSECTFDHHFQLNDPKSKPAFMRQREYQPALQTISKKFPQIDNLQLPILKENHQEILKTLEPIYLTFIDILQFKEHIGTV